jgi:hypothetical protein
LGQFVGTVIAAHYTYYSSAHTIFFWPILIVVFNDVTGVTLLLRLVFLKPDNG